MKTQIELIQESSAKVLIARKYAQDKEFNKAREYYEDALKELKEALAMGENPEITFALSSVYNDFGSFEQSQKQYQKAREYLLESNKMLKDLTEAFPQTIEFKNSLAMSYDNMGFLENMSGNPDEAVTNIHKALSIDKDLWENAHFEPALEQLALSNNQLGTIYFDQKNYKEAESCFILAKDYTEKLLEKTVNDNYLFLQEGNYAYLGAIAAMNDEPEKAQSYREKSLEFKEKLSKS